MWAPETRQAMGNAGQQAVSDRHNWEHDTAVLIDELQRLVATRR